MWKSDDYGQNDHSQMCFYEQAVSELLLLPTDAFSWDFSADVTTQQVSSLANHSFGVLTGSVNSPMTVTSSPVSFTKHLFSSCPMWKYKQEAKFVQKFTSKSVNTRSCILSAGLPLSLRAGWGLPGDVVLTGRRGRRERRKGSVQRTKVKVQMSFGSCRCLSRSIAVTTRCCGVSPTPTQPPAQSGAGMSCQQAGSAWNSLIPSAITILNQ